MKRVVIDTNVFVAALCSNGGASRQVIRKALMGEIQPVFGNALWSEYCDVLSRPMLWKKSKLTAEEREEVQNALAVDGEWVKIYYRWRPNLPDEGDNHLIELAMAANTKIIITHNVKDFVRAELKLIELQVLTPGDFLEKIK